MTTKLQMIGNAALLALPDKVAFFSSLRISAADVLKCYEWGECAILTSASSADFRVCWKGNATATELEARISDILASEKRFYQKLRWGTYAKMKTLPFRLTAESR